MPKQPKRTLRIGVYNFQKRPKQTPRIGVISKTAKADTYDRGKYSSFGVPKAPGSSQGSLKVSGNSQGSLKISWEFPGIFKGPCVRNSVLCLSERAEKMRIDSPSERQNGKHIFPTEQ